MLAAHIQAHTPSAPLPASFIGMQVNVRPTVRTDDSLLGIWNWADIWEKNIKIQNY